MTNETPLNLGFINHPDDGSIGVLEEITNCFAGVTRREALELEVSQNPYKVDVAAWFKSIQSGWAPALKELVYSAIPFDKTTARAVRDYLEDQPADVQANVAAYFQLGNRFGQFTRLNGNQIRAYFRKPWGQLGYRLNPLPFVVTCPQCKNPSPCSLEFSSGHRVLAGSQMTCPHCQYEEEIAFENSWWVHPEPGYPNVAELSSDFEAIASKQSAHWVSEAKNRLLPALLHWLNGLENMLKLESASLPKHLAEMDRPCRFGYQNTGWTIRLYGHGTFELSSNLLQGYVSPASRSNARGYGFTRTLDSVLDDVDASKFERHIVPVQDAVVHWRAEFNEKCALLADALAEKDLVRSSAMAADLAYAIHNLGIVCNMRFRWSHPPTHVLMQAELARYKGAPVREGAGPLAEFLSNGLSRYGVPVEDVATLLHRYSAAASTAGLLTDPLKA